METVGHKKNRFSYLDETTDQSHVSFIGTAEALAGQATQENFDKGSIFPPFTNIRKISARIAAAVAAKAYELGTHVLCFALQTPFHILAFTTKVSYLPDLTSSTSLCRFGDTSASPKRPGEICRELHVHSCLP
jgi:malate dehydrogenase (oxaloacetate-decarboxylating)(NADP+)